jgi:two-component system, sensor histidine kinase PdtaS
MTPQQKQNMSPDIGLNLALAVVASSAAPLVLLDGDLTLLAVSDSFCRAFEIDPGSVDGRPFRELGSGEWDIPQLFSMLKATASGFAKIEGYEIDLRRDGQEPRRLVLCAQKLSYGNEGSVRLLVSIADVTEARIAEKLKDDMLKEKAILQQELQHRVANSLQIIASVLMQSARNVQSEETRGHLVDAHQRVMSVAALQKHLAASKAGDVELRPYFTALCESIGASMIRDHNQLSLDVAVDDSVTSADVSVSLGLIVTELVINALKHAFPDHRSGGRIMVGYHSNGADWKLSVTDNGVGMRAGASTAKPGLGTNIIEALTRQLDALVEVKDAKPGTAVSIVHTGIAQIAKPAPFLAAV